MTAPPSAPSPPPSNSKLMTIMGFLVPLLVSLIGAASNIGAVVLHTDPKPAINCVDALSKAIDLDAKSKTGHIPFYGPEEDTCHLTETIRQMNGGK